MKIQITFQKTLAIKNLSDSKVVFKVKTTQPSWYYVRPNQQILDVNQTESVQILVVEAECRLVIYTMHFGYFIVHFVANS